MSGDNWIAQGVQNEHRKSLESIENTEQDEKYFSCPTDVHQQTKHLKTKIS